jgi:CheY-like chemotaxis protein
MLAKRIIFVEDDQVLSLDVCHALEEFGYIVDPFYSAPLAIEAINGRDYITALVTDIDLGAGSDGFQIAAQARARYPHLPIVFASGTHGAQHRSYGVRGSVFVAKPYHPHQIVHALQEVIRLEAA